MNGCERLKFIKPQDEPCENVRAFLKRHEFSTSLIAKVKMGGCFINGETVHMRATVAPGDTVEVILPIENSDGIPPISIPLDIVYEDDWLLAINKPTRMPVHPSKGNSLPTLANAVAAYLGEPFVFRAVNRLDRDTSGIVVVAKNQLSSAILCRAVKERQFKKYYYARVAGCPKPEIGKIDAPIKREAEGAMKRIVHESGKPSVTDYRVLSVDKSGNALCEIQPITGRTHQIRVHMASIGHPLVNDFLYGKRDSTDQTYSLHCGRLELAHPATKEPLILCCDPK